MPIIHDIAIALGLFVLLVVAFEIGFRAARRAHEETDPRAGGQVGAIQGAILGLLGLLLAFSFAAAGARFLERQDLIVREANAIGTAYFRADLLDDPFKSELRSTLRQYTQHRIDVAATLRSQGIETDVALEVQRLQAHMWKAATDGVAGRPAMALAVLNPLNDVIDLHSLRIAAGKKHLPPFVMGLLIVSSALSIAVIGYGCGIGQRRRAPLTLALAALIGAALWATIDLDHPRAGLMQLNDAPLRAIDFDGMVEK